MPYSDPVKQKESQHRSYLRNKDVTIKRALEHKRRDQQWFKEIKSQKVCADCGHDVYEDLDFHHIDPATKIMSVSDMLGTYGRKKVLAEMAKCEVLCKSCHKKHHP